jgi:hypothetical protein
MTSMTGSFMRYCKKWLSPGALALLFVCLWTSVAQASGISVNKAGIRASDDGYHLSANYNIDLPVVVQQALSRGVTLYFVVEFSLTRPRWYWLEEEIFQGEQTIKLSYNVLTRQYRISRGALFQNFANFEEALNMLSRQNSPAIAAELLKPDSGYFSEWIKRDGNYIAAIRLRLDAAQLPKLLQVNALTNSDWTLNSDWYRWIVSPEEFANHRMGKTE